MKKVVTAILIVCIAIVCFALAGCSGKSYTGECHYNSYGTEYGIKVKVTVDGDVIKSVKVVGSDYVEVSDPMGEWTQENVDNWRNNVNGLLKKYEGMKVSDVMALKADIVNGSLATEKSELGGLVIDGATVGSARLLIAVQSALSEIQ